MQKIAFLDMQANHVHYNKLQHKLHNNNDIYI